MVNKIKFSDRVNSEFIVLAALILVAFFIRIWQIWTPETYVFDEIYYAEYAKSIIAHASWIDVHPPLGELLIALGIKIFGDNAFGWRIVPALIGTAVIPLGYAVAKKIFSSAPIALLTAFFIAFDGLFIVQSRNALLIIFVCFFVLFAYLFALYFFDTKKYYYLLLSSLAMGLALSVQWTAAPFWLVLMLWIIFYLRKNIKLLIPSIVTFLVFPILIYLSSFIVIFDGNYFEYLKYWHTRTWEFHKNLKGDHEFASRWYTWPILKQPITYWQAKYENGNVAYVLALGNPVVWWSGIAGVVYSIYYFIKNKAWFLALPLVSFLGFFLGWSVISREQFIYYMLLALPFYFMLLAFTLVNLYKRYKMMVVIWTIIAIAVFLFFYPMNVAIPIPFSYYKLTLWLPSWQNINLLD